MLIPPTGDGTERPKLVMVTKEDYEKMTRNSRFLESLQAAGVDNWSGYDYAWEIFHESYPEYKEE